MKKRITASERRRMDYLRVKGLKVGHAYEVRLVKARRAEVRRLLELCRNWGNVEQWPSVIAENLDESYLSGWFAGLYRDAGLPRALAVAQDLSRGKSSPEEDYWLTELERYAAEQAGEKIVLVEGTMRDALVDLTRHTLTDLSEAGVEKVAKTIFKNYQAIELWQARRIAQTETMIGLAEAGAIAADTLDVRFTKQWCISGLGNTRDTHEAMDGETVGQDEEFQLEDCRMRWPHDASLGAPASEIINCACDVIRRPV